MQIMCCSSRCKIRHRMYRVYRGYRAYHTCDIAIVLIIRIALYRCRFATDVQVFLFVMMNCLTVCIIHPFAVDSVRLMEPGVAIDEQRRNCCQRLIQRVREYKSECGWPILTTYFFVTFAQVSHAIHTSRGVCIACVCCYGVWCMCR